MANTNTDAMSYPMLLALEEHQIRHIYSTYIELERKLGESMQIATDPIMLDLFKKDYHTVQGIRFKMQQLLNQKKQPRRLP